MSRTALVTGATGLLGRQVRNAFEDRGWKAVGTGVTRADPPFIIKLDVLDKTEIQRVLDDVKPEVVVHCAANRFPDSCESNPDAARALNVSASSALASATSARNILLIYISTGYVFSGAPGEAPYTPTSATAPPNIYGETKLDGERAVLAASAPGKAVVLRVPILYGPCEKPAESAVNVLVDQVWAAQKVKEGDKKIKVDDYAQRYPTNTQDVGRVCVDISMLYLQNQGQELPPILHFSSEDRYTKWGMVQVFADILGLPVDGMESFKPDKAELSKEGGVKRPYDCHLDTGELKKLGISVETTDFVSWWRREFRAFRH